MMRVVPDARVSLESSAVLEGRRANALRFQRTVRLAVQFADLVLAVVAFVAAYYLRYALGVGGDVADENFVPVDSYIPLIAAVTLAFFLVGRVSRMYDSVLRRPLVDEAWNIVQYLSLTMMLLFGMVFLTRGLAYSRGLFIMAWALTAALLVADRVLGRVALTLLRRRGIGVERVLVVGSGRLAQAVMYFLTTEPGISYRLVGFVHPHAIQDIGRFQCLGAVTDLAQTLHSHQIDEVIMALPPEEHQLLSAMTGACAGEGVAYKVVPDLFEMSISLSPVDVAELRGIPLIGPRDLTIRGSDLLLKRAMDIAVAGTVLLLGSPLWLAVALAIKWGSPGPVVFVQRRVGRDGRVFDALKFRSMYVDAERRQAELMAHNEADGPIFKMRNDPRITGTGRWLRRTSLDELPQLLNVLAGDMSLVGPRPPLPSEVEQYEDWHLRRLSVAPGLTGMWQVSGRSELPFDAMVLLDISYIRNWSLGLDLQILLRTIPAVLSGHGAY